VNLKIDADNPADREKLRRAILDLVAGRKIAKTKRAWLTITPTVGFLVSCRTFAPGHQVTLEAQMVSKASVLS
jgi:hypothetical protein